MAITDLQPRALNIAQSATTSGTWTGTGGTVGYYYRLNVTAGATGGAAGNATGPIGATTFTLNAVTSATKLPAAGTTGTTTYTLQESTNGSTYTNTAITNVTVTRLPNAPTTSATQSFNTTTASNTITHAIVYTAGAAPSGTIEFAVSTTASTYAAVTGWTTVNSFTLTRGTTYYFWTRSAADALVASVQQLTVPYVATTLGVGTVSRTPAGDISGGATSVVVNFTGTAAHKYKLVQTAPSVADMVVGSVLGATGATSLTLTSAASALPGEANVWTYKVQVIREVANGGDGVWYDATGTGVSFTILRIQNPTVNNDQGFDTTYNNSFFTHTITLKNEGVGGTLQFSYADTGSSTGTYPIEANWSTTRTMVAVRGTSYYIWARRIPPAGPNNDASDFDRNDSAQLVPAWQGIDVTDSTYGIQINNASGVPVLTMASRIARLLDVGTTSSVAAGGTYTSPTISSIDTYINSHVAVIAPSDATYKLNSLEVSVDYTAKTFSIKNNTGTAKTYTYYVFRSG